MPQQEVKFADFGLAADREHLIFEFRSQKFLGKFTGSFTAPMMDENNGMQVFAIRGTDVRCEEQNTYNPATVVRGGKVYLLYRADDRSPDLRWGRTCRIGLATCGDEERSRM